MTVRNQDASAPVRIYPKYIGTKVFWVGTVLGQSVCVSFLSHTFIISIPHHIIITSYRIYSYTQVCLLCLYINTALAEKLITPSFGFVSHFDRPGEMVGFSDKATTAVTQQFTLGCYHSVLTVVHTVGICCPYGYKPLHRSTKNSRD